MSFFNRLIPTYGNWGGPGWSGGKRHENYKNTDWSVEALDSMDELFKEHDKKYQKAIEKYNSQEIDIKEKNKIWLDADKKLIENLDFLSQDPNKWFKKPLNITWAWLYRKSAIFLFQVKVFIIS